jgi:hypothetical protein
LRGWDTVYLRYEHSLKKGELSIRGKSSLEITSGILFCVFKDSAHFVTVCSTVQDAAQERCVFNQLNNAAYYSTVCMVRVLSTGS